MTTLRRLAVTLACALCCHFFPFIETTRFDSTLSASRQRQALSRQVMSLNISQGRGAGTAGGAEAAGGERAPQLRAGGYAAWKPNMDVYLQRHGAAGVHTREMTADKWAELTAAALVLVASQRSSIMMLSMQSAGGFFRRMIRSTSQRWSAHGCSITAFSALNFPPTLLISPRSSICGRT